MTLRLAVPADVPAIEALIAESVRTLQAGDYSQEQRDGAMGVVFGADHQLIADGTFYVAEVDGRVVGCGGWSRRKTLFGTSAAPGRDDEPLDPKKDAARMRGFFVHPDRARKGVASAILMACESAAIAFGFTRAELASTLTGVGLWATRGYIGTERFDVPLPNGAALPVVSMRKDLSAAAPPPPQGFNTLTT